MERNTNLTERLPRRLWQEEAVQHEEFIALCLRNIRTAPNAEAGLRSILCFLGESLECDRVYVFEEMDRQHIRNTYEWCRAGVSSGIEELPYVAKKDLLPWYERLATGNNIIEPNVMALQRSDPLIYAILQIQQIDSIILSPLMAEGRMIGLLGADNPPPEKLEHISVVFDVLAYFVCGLVSQRELAKLRPAQTPPRRTERAARFKGKKLLLVDDSQELLRLNARVLRPEGYDIRAAASLCEARTLMAADKPDAILMDIDLPDGDGLAFCRELRRDHRIPVVFLTARSDEQTAREGLRAGGCAFLTKPYRLEELRTAVADAVSGHQTKQTPDGEGDAAAWTAPVQKEEII